MDPRPDIGRSRSLTSAANRMSFGSRPSDAIIDRVDEIQRSVERLRQSHVGPMRECAISARSARSDSIAPL